jgi:23S rRNA (cytosine1962-C5)-methyltransferase
MKPYTSRQPATDPCDKIAFESSRRENRPLGPDNLKLNRDSRWSKIFVAIYYPRRHPTWAQQLRSFVPIRINGPRHAPLMFPPDQYELLDFGAGRKLERFGGFVVDRPAPGTNGTPKRDESLWRAADARYDARQPSQRRWKRFAQLPRPWRIAHDRVRLELRLTASGQVGVFPEQADNWCWLGRQVRRRGGSLRVLNLFAYTGASTLAAAAEGAEVVHVDASQTAVNWARRNAALSRLSDRPIRWIVDDACAFVKRELRRGNRYAAIILDPPSYGHGPRGQVWKLEDNMEPLLLDCRRLLGSRGVFVLLTCHTTGWSAAALRKLVDTALPDGATSVGTMKVRCADGRPLPGGMFARWTIDEA